MFRRFTSFLSILAIFFVSSQLLPQSGTGFYDEYNMDLRNLPRGESETEGEERFSTYTIPPRNEKNFVVTPKKVGRLYDPLLSIPGAGSIQNQITQQNNQNVNQANSRNTPAPLINPITGEVNQEAVNNSLTNQSQNRSKKEKDRLKFKEETVYKESKLRRFQIIFFLTMPFALGVSAGAAGLLGIERMIEGSILMITGTSSLSAANAYQDLKKLEEHKKIHGTEWPKDEDIAVTSP
ncbi:MAG: hypothetical protein MH321_02555 [Leptospiraceae bacterium]|nr:hypothetical protein [Leptospiraceae bacterium]